MTRPMGKNGSTARLDTVEVDPMRVRGVYKDPRGGTLVYVARDAKSVVLYVGITDNLFQRMAAHMHESAWWDRMASIDWEEMPDRQTAMRREIQLVRRHRPPFNVMLQPDPTAISQIPTRGV